jgi:hypothetical protein
MSDKELLEFAAKAADIMVVRSRLDDPLNKDFLVENSHRNEFQSAGPWNPFTDDGDALRLAVTLNIDIEFREGEVWAYRHAFADGECFTATERLADHQPENCGTGCRATRRAIVRAAAEIGKAMP